MFTNVPTVTGYVSNNYFSTKVGLLIGGGKRNENRIERENLLLITSRRINH